jgi:large subunit ribosomal protein L21
MFAIVKTGGKQYRVEKNAKLVVEKLDGAVGDKVTLDVMMVDGKVGAPLVAGASVTAEIVAHDKADKVLIFKKRRRKGYRNLRGHRQPQTTIQVTDIKA